MHLDLRAHLEVRDGVGGTSREKISHLLALTSVPTIPGVYFLRT